MNKLLLTLSFALLISCTAKEKTNQPLPQGQRPSSLKNGKIFFKEGRKYLFGGKDSTWHFDVTNSPLIDSQYHYGIGREQFKALTDPEFISEAEASKIYHDTARFLLFTLGNETRAYGIDLLTQHEVVNDVVNGEPVAAAYCILADLGAMYSRKVGDTVLTFALSGFTYYDPQVWNGMDGFVWWDRETESTWWPLISKGVSGPLKDVPLKVFEEKSWKQTTWGNIVGKHKNLKVLKPGQTMEVPNTWPKFDAQLANAIREMEAEEAIAPPHWGENAKK
ncbi:MAG: DUF3179 domain-containing (seleno)protein [Cyclobacteriaceae bacterium]